MINFVCETWANYMPFQHLRAREKAGLLKEQRKLLILLSDAVLLSIWLWHYSLAPVISLCLRLLIQTIHQKINFSARTLRVRIWTVNCFYFCRLWCAVAAYGGLTKPPSSLLGSWDSWLQEFTSSGYSLIMFPSSQSENGFESALNFIECLANMIVLLLLSVRPDKNLTLIVWD